MNKIYSTFYGQRVFTLGEARKLFRSVQVTKNTLHRLLKKKLIKKIRRGIYYIVPFDNEHYTPDSLLIASKLRKKTFFCLWTALHIHDLAESKTLFLESTSNSLLKIYGVSYRLIRMKPGFGIEERTLGNQKVLVTDLERTFLDCLNHIEEFESLQEFFSIWSNANLNISKVIDHLKQYRKKKLYHYAGYALDRLKEFAPVNDKDLEKIAQGISKKTYYLQIRPKAGYARIKERFTKQNSKYHKRWKLIVVE